MDTQNAPELEEKNRFIISIQNALLLDQDRNWLDCICYQAVEREGCLSEYIDVIRTDGSCKRILATGQSNGQSLKEIINYLY